MSIRREFFSYSQPIRFVRLDSKHTQNDMKFVIHGPSVLDLPRGRDSWCRHKGARTLRTRMLDGRKVIGQCITELHDWSNVRTTHIGVISSLPSTSLTVINTEKSLQLVARMSYNTSYGVLNGTSKMRRFIKQLSSFSRTFDWISRIFE